MAATPRIRLEGSWNDGGVLLGAELEAFDAARPKYINGTEGGTWAPSAEIILGGSGLRVTGNARFDAITVGVLAGAGTFTVANTSDLIVASGGDLIVQEGGDLDIGTGVGLANLTVKSGAAATIAAGGAFDMSGATTFYGASTTTFNADAVLDQLAGAVWSLAGGSTYSVASTVTFNGATTFGNSTHPKLGPARAFEVHCLTPVPLTWEATSPAADPHVWLLESNVSAPAPMARTRAATASGSKHLIKLDGLPPGGDLDEVVVTTRGDSGTGAFTRPTYRIIRYKGVSAVEYLSPSTTDSHAADGSDWTTDVLETTLTPVSAPHPIDATYTYAVLVTHPYNGVGVSMNVYDCKATGTFDELRIH